MKPLLQTPPAQPRRQIAASLLMTAAGLGTLLVLAYGVAPALQPPDPLRVAFIGNSMFYVNDIPRFMEELSQSTMIQDSCLHGGRTLRSLLRRGNGMYFKFKSSNAKINTTTSDTTTTVTTYDWGQCTVPQLLFGTDENLETLFADDDQSYYYRDRKNPCFRDEYYLEYLTEENQRRYNGKLPQWDFVAMNDQTRFPALYQTRQISIKVLQQVYSNYFLSMEGSPRPVFLATHAYIYNKTNDNILSDVPTFTSKVYYGYRMYAQALSELLPPEQEPLIAPSTIAFLTVWEENPKLWPKLFHKDGLHASPHGSYLKGCVLFATLYGHMPRGLSSWDARYLFRRARRREPEESSSDNRMPFPTVSEAQYLYQVAKRVVLNGHRPASLLTDEEIEALEESERMSYYNNNNM